MSKRDFRKSGFRSYYFRERVPRFGEPSEAMGKLAGYGTNKNLWGDEFEYWDESLAKAVADLHDGINRQNANASPLPDSNKPPELILVSALSAIPFAYAIKEFWKVAYPAEKSPLFRIIDTSRSQTKLDSIRGLDDRLKNIARTTGITSNVAVFDEYMLTGGTLRTISERLMVAGYEDINFMRGQWSSAASPDRIEIPMRRVYHPEGDDIVSSELVLNITPDSKNLIRDMKFVGRLMVGMAIVQGRVPEPAVEAA